MDFDEYDYLEKTVEGVHIPKESNGGGGRDRRYAPKRTIPDDGYGFDDRSKTNRSGQVLDRREWPTKAHGFRDRRYREGLNDREKQRGEVGEKGRVRIDRYKEHGVNDRDRSDRDTRDIDTREKVKGRDDRTHDKDKERDRDLEVDMGRSHSRSRGLDRPLDQRKRVRGRDREWGRQMELMDPDKDQEGEHGPSGERREKEEPVPAEPEADPERDQRTVFAYQVSLKADEKDVYEFFSMAGKVRDVRLIMDRNSKRSKGVGYIEFYDAMSVPVAIAMSGQLLRGQPIMVKPSEAEKNLVQSTSAVGGNTGGFIGPYSGGARRLYVGNLHFNITEDQLRQVFEPFGPVELVQVPTDPEAGQCKGFGFVQYARLEDARAAQQALNGVLELAGRVIKVSAVSDQIGMPDIGGTSGELDDDEGGGLSLTARSRALLMQKLDRSGTVTSIAAPVTRPALGLLAGAVPTATISPLVSGSVLGQVGLSGIASVNAGLGAATLGSSALEPVGAPTDCLMLKNMFDPKTEMEPDFDLDIKDEVQHECSKFGVVKHIFVDKNSLGHVFLRFDTLTAAVNAQRALHGRWFAGKMITTQFLTPRAYEAKFPECQ